MTVDFDKIMNGIVDRGRVALERTTSYTLQRAQEHAPVRAIFDSSQSPRGPAFPKSFKTIRNEKRYQAFLRSKRRNQQVTLRDLSGEVDRQRGHPNSLIPVIGGKTSGGTRFKLTGDLRRFSAKSGGLAEVPVKMAVGRSDANTIRGKGNEFLTSRGRYEVKRAKKSQRRGTPAGSSGLFGGRVGGRLRGELRKSQQVWRGNVLWQYVESPTPYAKYQEFGTSRHRPQPFLRPALYESRQRLRSEVRKIDADTRGNVRMARQARDLGPKSNPLTGG